MLAHIGLILLTIFVTPSAHGAPWGMRAQKYFWTSGKVRDSLVNAFVHFRRHRAEFPEYQNVLSYVLGTHRFLKNPSADSLTKICYNGDKVIYDPNLEIMAVETANGTPRTMFKPHPSKHGFPTNLHFFRSIY